MAGDRVLILRPQPQAAETAAFVKAAGYQPVLYPIMDYVEVGGGLIDTSGFTHLLFTSAAAVRISGPRIHEKRPAICVGPVTAEAAVAAGFEVVLCGRGGTSSLAHRLPEGPILHLCGADHLPFANKNVVRKVVYKAEPRPLAPLPEDLAALLVHSRRSGELLLKAHMLPKTLPVIAISARAVTPFAAHPVTIAAEPNDRALMTALKLALACGAG